MVQEIPDPELRRGEPAPASYFVLFSPLNIVCIGAPPICPTVKR